MKIKIIETLVLLSIIALLGAGGDGCDGSCLDFDIQLSKLLGLSHYIICSKDPVSGVYGPMELSVNIPGLTSGETYAPTSAFDCGTSMDGQASLPHMKAAAAIPPDASVSPSLREPSAEVFPNVQGPPYRTYGWNDGYVPPTVIHPNIPVPSSSDRTVPSSCPARSPDVLIVNHLHNAVTRLGTCPLSTKATIQLVSRPLQVAVTPDGSQAIVTNFDNAISFINLSSNAVSFTLKTDGAINPAGVAITPDGKRAYVTSFNNFNPAILVIDIASHAIVTTISSANAWPKGVFITPDGSQAWISYPYSNEVDIFDTLTNTRSAARIVNSPQGIAFNSTGTRAYVASNGTPGTLVVFDTATLQSLKSYTVGTYPLDVKVMPGDQFVLVNNFGSANLSLVDTGSGKVETSKPADNVTQSLGLVPIY